MKTFTALPQRKLTLPALTLAADARLSRVDYTDDQSWEVLPGKPDSAALVLQTHYGGRVGLASLVPMWNFPNERRTVVEAQGYARPPQIVAFAPGFARLEAALTPSLTLTAEIWVMDSHAVGTRYTLHNSGGQPVTLRLDLFAQVAAQGKALKLAVVTLGNGTQALALGNFARLAPAVMLDNAVSGGASAAPGSTSPKIGMDLTIEVGASTQVRWVHGGLSDLRDSLALAEKWLAQDWDAHFERVARAAQALPVIETGTPDLDQAIAVSVHQVAQSLMKYNSLPHPSPVATRQSGGGFSPRGDGTDLDRAWSGQTPQLAVLLSPTLATIDPALAKGLLLNFLAVQTPDGGIDGKPGLAGQRQGSLSIPVLARLALELYTLIPDEAFARQVLPGLMRFYDAWLRADQDADQDGFPEWQSERQTGYVYLPTFAAGQTWAQNGDLRTVESPDLAAYLLSEARSLQALAQIVGDQATQDRMTPEVTRWQGLLEALWQNDHYAYRDRDTHQVAAPGTVLLEEGRADEDLVLSASLQPPARLLIRITGGADHAPKLSLALHGTNPDGNAITETADWQKIGWYRGYGVYVSQQVFGFVDKIQVEGLSRVYRISVSTVDLSRQDITGLMPLWSGAISSERAAALVKTVTDPARFWRPNGVSMTPADDPNFDPSNAGGGGGIWLYWLTLIGEGLLKYGYDAQAAGLVRRIMTAQAQVLRQDGHFQEFYHSDEPRGSGETGNLAGIVPLGLLHRVIGVWILSPAQVYTGGKFAWGTPVTVRQHGVTVTRGPDGTTIEFPSGHTVKRPADTVAWETVIDPTPVAPLPPDDELLTIAVSDPINPEQVSAGTGKVVIQVEDGSEPEKPVVAEIKPDSDENG